MERVLFEAETEPEDLGFSREELDGRVQQVQAIMASRDLDILVVSDQIDIQYLTGARDLAGSLPMVLVVPQSGLYTLVTRAVDALAFIPQCFRSYILEYTDDKSPMDAIALGIRSYGIDRARIGSTLSGRSLSVRLVDDLRAEFSEHHWEDSSRVVWELGALKSEAELSHMSRVADINTSALRAAVGSMAPGVADHEVAATLLDGMLREGSHMTPGYFQLVSGVRSSIAHATHNGSVLGEQDHILFEYSASRFRYVSPLMRTATVGKPTNDLQKMHDAAQTALEAAVSIMRPGVTSAAVHEAANEALDKYNMRNLRPHRTGYMVGTVASSTGWTQGHVMNLRSADERKLEENMTFHLPLALYRPGIAAVGVSETVVVTPSGGQVLGDAPRGLLRAEDYQ